MAAKLLNFRQFLGPQLKRLYSQKSEGLPDNLRRAFEKFQRDDGVPVYLKGGLGDRLLLGFTTALIAVGVLNSMYTIARLDRKK